MANLQDKLLYRIAPRTEWTCGNIHIRPMLFWRRGFFIPGHQHNFAHTTFFYTGRYRVRRRRGEGPWQEQVFVAPAHCLIEADMEHEITDIRPTLREAWRDRELLRLWFWNLLLPVNVAWCVYSHRDPQGEVIQENIGWSRAYGWTPPNV